MKWQTGQSGNPSGASRAPARSTSRAALAKELPEMTGGPGHGSQGRRHRRLSS
ncbi:MAG: hypothetical protein MZV65_00765 [Chromatiales bacterium]|nr:hypothetical protein [Chromatiales bacterium]